MMKKFLLFLFTSGIMLLMVSCEKTFNTVSNYDVRHTPLIAVSLSNQTIDDYIKGSITATRPVTGPVQGNSMITDAKALILENGMIKDSLTYFFPDDFYLSSTNLWTSGKTYQLMVSSPGKKTIEATDIMPSKVVPVSFIRKEKVRSFLIPEYDTQPILCDEITLTFDDPAGEKNYYQFDFQVKDSFQFGWNYSYNIITFEKNIETDYDDDFDPGASGLMKYGAMYCSDDDFNGQRRTFIFYAPSNQNTSNPIEFALKSMSANYYLYTRSFQRYLNTEGNPFSEPVQVFSNVKNGAGIFALQQTWRDTL